MRSWENESKQKNLNASAGPPREHFACGSRNRMARRSKPGAALTKGAECARRLRRTGDRERLRFRQTRCAAAHESAFRHAPGLTDFGSAENSRTYKPWLI